MSGKISYIKIPKIDNNGVDLTPTLSSLTQITIPYTNGSSSICPVIGITDAGDYFTYLIGNVEGPNPELSNASTLGYNFTGSITTNPITLGGVNYSRWPEFNTVTGEVPTSSSLLPYLYNPNDDSIEIKTLPQKDLVLYTSNFYSSGSFGGTSTTYEVELYKSDATRTNRTRLTNSTSIQSGGWKGPFTRQATIPSESISPGDILYLGCQGKSLASGIQNVSVKLNLDVGRANSANILLTSNIASGGTIIETVPEPYFTATFNGTDCDVTFGNIDQYPPNPFLQDIDYSTNPTVPINIEKIISGTADKGTVPESYYTSHAQINSRYLGSKNQSSGVNKYVLDAGNTDFGTPINIGTYGNVSPITENEANLFEYEWGETSYPMIPGYGQLKLSNILQVASEKQVKIVQKTSNAVKKSYPDGRLLTVSAANIRDYRLSTNPLDPRSSSGSIVISGKTTKYYWTISQSRGEFYQVLNNSNPINTILQLGNYSANSLKDPIMPNTSKIAATGWGTPPKPDYMFTSSFNEGQTSPSNSGATFPISQWISGSYGVIRKQQPYQLIMSRSDPMTKTLLNSVGAVTMDKDPNATLPLRAKEVLNGLNSSMTQGSRWYLTLYRQLNDPGPSQSLEDALDTGNNLQPYNFGYDQLNGDGNYDYPLAAKGAYEIVGTNVSFAGGTYDSGTVFFILKPEVKFDPNIRSGSAELRSGSILPTNSAGDSGRLRNSGTDLYDSITSFPSSTVAGTYTNIELEGGSLPGRQAKVTIVASGNTLSSITVTFGGAGYAAGDTITIAQGQLGVGSGGVTINSLNINNVITSNYAQPLGVPSGSFNLQAGNINQTFQNVKSSNYNITCSITVLSDTVFDTISNLSVVTPYGDFVDGQLVSGWIPGDVVNFSDDQFGGGGGTGLNFEITANKIIDNEVEIINIGTSDSSYYNQYPNSPNNNLGAFMWEATGKEQITGEEYVIIQDELKGVGPGYFMDEFVPEYITNNVEKITKEFGSNKT